MSVDVSLDISHQHLKRSYEQFCLLAINDDLDSHWGRLLIKSRVSMIFWFSAWMVYSRLERQLPMMNQKFEIKKNKTIIIDELSSIIKILDSMNRWNF